MQKFSIKQKPQKQGYGIFGIFVPLFIGLHIGWYMLQKHYVPLEERHDHPLIELYKKYTT